MPKKINPGVAPHTMTVLRKNSEYRVAGDKYHRSSKSATTISATTQQCVVPNKLEQPI